MAGARKRHREPPRESSIYDGPHLLGTITPAGGVFIARTAVGKKIGEFNDEKLAMRAFAAARAESRRQSVRPPELLSWLIARLRRPAPSPTAALEHAASDGEVARSFPAETYKAMLDQMIELAADCGRREERERIRVILTTPEAEGLSALAWFLVEKNTSPECAQATLRAARADAAAPAATGEPIRLH